MQGCGFGSERGSEPQVYSLFLLTLSSYLEELMGRKTLFCFVFKPTTAVLHIWIHLINLEIGAGCPGWPISLTQDRDRLAIAG